MSNSVTFLTRTLFASLTVLVPCGVSIAAIDEFSPYAYAKVLHDTNIFRVSGDAEAIDRLGDDNRDDTVGHLGAGFKSDLKLSRQHLLLNAEVDRAIYDTFDDLDHTRVDGTAAWAWQVGNLWSGKLGYGYNRSMRSFTENTVEPLDKDMRTRHVGFLDAGYQIHPDWELLGGVNVSDVSYQDRKRLNREAYSGQLEVQYRNTLNTRVGVRLKYTDNDLKEREVSGVSIDNDYTETEISGTFHWEGTGKSSFSARLGYTDQSYDELDDRDYQGSTGRLTWHWLATGKTRVNVSAWRETSTKNDEISSYVLTKGASVSPIWDVTPIIAIKGLVSYQDDDYKGQNDIVTALGGQRRNDDTWRVNIGANWAPRRFLNASLGYTWEDRDSSIDRNDFDSKRVEAKVGVKF